jgi:glutamate racemase
VEQGVDTLVLGCTHYVFLAPEIERLAGAKVQVIEPSAAVARQGLRQLEQAGFSSPKGGLGSAIFMTTGERQQAERLFSQLWGERLDVLPLNPGSARQGKLANTLGIGSLPPT